MVQSIRHWRELADAAALFTRESHAALAFVVSKEAEPPAVVKISPRRGG
jgi:hypothetical protein